MEEASPAMTNLAGCGGDELRVSARGYITREQAAVTRRFLKQPLTPRRLRSRRLRSRRPLWPPPLEPQKETAGGGREGGARLQGAGDRYCDDCDCYDDGGGGSGSGGGEGPSERRWPLPVAFARAEGAISGDATQARCALCCGACGHDGCGEARH